MIQQATRLDAYQLMHYGTLAFARAEQQGMRIDVDYCERKVAHLARKVEFLEREFKQGDFFKHWQHVYEGRTKITSDDQLAHLIYDVRKITPTKTTPSGRGATDEEALTQIANSANIPDLLTLMEFNKFKKLKKGNLASLLREQIGGYIHPFFNLHLVRTYRSSSDHPNWQNLPKRDYEAMQLIRRAIFARLGHQIMEPDFSGIEVRISECYHHDPNMRKYIMDPTTDMHRDMAIQIFKLKEFNKKIPGYATLRQAAKNGFVFPQFYGDYYKACAENMACSWGKLPKGKWYKGQGIEIVDGLYLSDWLISVGLRTYEDFENHMQNVEKDFWGNRFRVYQKWKDQWWEEYQRQGYFDLLTGFRCSGVMSKKEVCNYPIQGSAFHCLLYCFIRIDQISREENWDTRLTGQIHDSMILDTHPEERDHVYRTVKQVAEVELPKVWSWINVPMEIEVELSGVDRPWSEKKVFELKEAA